MEFLERKIKTGQREEKKEPTDDTSIDVYSQYVNATCFGHHYAHRQENRLYKTACVVSLDVLAAVVWNRDTSSTSRLTPDAVLYSLFS